MLGFIVFARNNKHENIKGAIYLLSKFMILFMILKVVEFEDLRLFDKT